MLLIFKNTFFLELVFFFGERAGANLTHYLLFLVASAAAGTGHDSNKTKQIIMIAGIVVGSAALLLGFAIFIVWKRRKSDSVNIVEQRGTKEMCLSENAVTCYICKLDVAFSQSETGPRDRSQDYLLNAPTIPSKRDQSGETAVDEIELPLFDITTLVIATNKFSDENKLGQGGFGIVYKVN